MVVHLLWFVKFSAFLSVDPAVPIKTIEDVTRVSLMHQPSTAESNPYSLHPALRCALATLDSHLEDELARYRRYRAGRTVAPSASNLPKIAVQPVAKRKETPSSVDLPFVFNPVPVVEDRAIDSGLPLAVWQGEAAYEEPEFDQSLSDPEMPDDYLASSEELLRSLADEERGEAIERNVLDNLLTPLGVGSLVLMLMGSAMFGYLVMNPASLAAAGRWAQKVASLRLPQGASEQQIAVGGSIGGTQSGWSSNAPSLDSQEFVDLSLNNFSAIRATPGGSMPILAQMKPKPVSPKQAVNPLKKLVTDKLLPLVGVKGLGVGPIFPQAPQNLANLPEPRRFEPPVVSLPQVSAAPERRNYSNLPAPRSYESAPRYSAPAPRYEAPAPRYEAPRYEAPRYEAPVVRSLPAPPPELPPAHAPSAEPAAAAAPSPQGDYRVVQPYTNDGALEAAQKVNPEASFRNLDDGAYVQHGGSYASKAEAESAAAALKEKGVEVEVK
jgi:hypothetical protein